MTCRYLQLSDKARLDETASIWGISDKTVRIPEEELDYLCAVDRELRDPDSPLKSVFSDLEYTVPDANNDYFIQSAIIEKKGWIASLEQFHSWILQSDREIWGLLPNAPEWGYENGEYARMIAAILQVIRESVRLDEPIDHWME